MLLEQFGATIDKIYAAAGGSISWREALVAVEDLTGGTGAVLDLLPKTATAQPKTLAGSFSDENCSEFAQNYMAICPRIRFAVEHAGRTQYDYLFMSEADMDRDPVYAWYGKHGLRYHVAGILAETPKYRAAFSLQRTVQQGHVGRRDVELFEMLKPHVARALSLADQLGTLRCFQRFSSAFVESLPQAVFALDGAGRLLFANSAGSELLAENDGLTTAAGQLRTAFPAEQSILDDMIRSAIFPLGSHATGWIRVSRPRRNLPLAVFVAPLNVCDEELTSVAAKVLVMAHDMGEQRPANPDMLTSIYSLTDTEARLASALSAGHSIESAAALHGMQPSTVRAHLKQIFAKVGVNRQQDLVRLLTLLSALH